ncbi:MAG: peptidoglycan DD-metalloendopeptidase family protein [Candidatus Uhrbacteria bacterium]|nr:peptidoglycan DD-metalloendopeptidase family protein [Candidatus Uhrbacteria bacterium]
MTRYFFRSSIALSFVAIFSFICFAPQTVIAQQDVDDLNDAIKNKQTQVKEIDSLIKSYKSKIAERQTEAVSLENQIALLENRVKEKELAIDRTRIEIESLTLEVELIEKDIAAKSVRLQKQKALTAQLIRDIHQADDVTPFDVFLTQPSLSEFFASLENLKKLNRDLGHTVAQTKTLKADLEARAVEKADKQARAEEERRNLKKEMLSLEAEKNFKESLIAQTKENEQEFQRILYELRQQQASTSDEVVNLENRLREQLRSVDDALARGNAALSWPVDPVTGITAIFHDPTYPFRNLFEHPGTDIRVAVGTPVKAAGGGYVAWNKTGRMYGNYLMLVHTGGLATVYAHLSKFIAKPDTFVERGDTIALSGGAAGMQGAGLSTGAHLHFEVRKDGIPVDAEKYLPQVPNDYYDYYGEYKALKIR